MMVFHHNYCFESKKKFGETMKFEMIKPTEEEVYLYAKYILISAKMEKEAPIMALIYIERLLSKTGTLLNHWNW